MKYAFAALLAVLSVQAVVPSVRVVATIEIISSKETEQRTPREARRIRVGVQVRQTAPTYVSRIRSEPDTAVLFQRPPPRSSLLS